MTHHPSTTTYFGYEPGTGSIALPTLYDDPGDGRIELIVLTTPGGQTILCSPSLTIDMARSFGAAEPKEITL